MLLKNSLKLKNLFLTDLENLPISFVASKWILEKSPINFGDDNDLYLKWKEKFSKKINVDSSAIVFTGSSAIGFSLNPRKSYRKFNAKSDIDIALVSDYYFDISWHCLRNLGVKYHSLQPRQKTSITDHINRLIYFGTIATDKILPILPFGKEWIIALNEMSNESPTLNRIINVRIYKDFNSLRQYHTNNLKNLRKIQLEN